MGWHKTPAQYLGKIMPFIKLTEPNVNDNCYGVDFKNSESQTSVDEATLAKIRAHGRQFEIRQCDKHELVQIAELQKEVAQLKKSIEQEKKSALTQTAKYESLTNDYAMLMEQLNTMRIRNAELEKQKYILSKLDKRYKDIKEQ